MSQKATEGGPVMADREAMQDEILAELRSINEAVRSLNDVMKELAVMGLRIRSEDNQFRSR